MTTPDTIVMTTHYHDNTIETFVYNVYLYIPAFILDGVGVKSSREGGRLA